jgi:hypothetical protein
MFTASDAISSMNFAQHQSMVQGMMPSNVAAEYLAGGMMSRGAAIGSPMMSGAAGMLGFDPLSLGVKAGMGIYGTGAVGLAGAAGVGMGVAGVAGIAGIGMQYAGGQMMQGAQQQMQLNQGLRQNYNFMNAQGGMGFTTNQGNQIGGAIRNMSHEVGPGGEHHGFDELARIATNLGRMGGAQNVRTVDDFKTKFKETLETLKKVSHDLGTSLEDAMKTIQSMKGTGIFKAADQVKMASDMRSTAMAGGMAMSEVTGMASIGSQISRAIGGRGISGANAGVRTIGQIGSATSVGAISEEDIYNATGQHGAEGRQALGAAQLQQSARFMSSSKGRYFLASIAGKNGELNQDSVDEWMSGGNMSTGRTAQMAHQNLAGVGRANFIRNEGRLRGEALSQFGGLAQSMALKQWMGSRGYDPSNMDDRSMLGFQRFTGMGRDEADVAIKQINHLPEIMQHQRDTQRGLGYADAMQRQRATTGLAGLQKDVNHWKEGVNSKLQGAGAGLLKAGSDTIEDVYNRAMGIHVESGTEGLAGFSENISYSTDAAAVRRSFRRTMGVGSGRGGRTGADISNEAAGRALRAARNGAGKEFVDLGKASSDAVMMASIGAVFDPNDPVGVDNALIEFKKNLPDDLRAKMIGDRHAQIGKMQSLQQGAGVDSKHQVANVLAGRTKEYSGASGGAFSESGRLEDRANTMLGRAALSDKDRAGKSHFRDLFNDSLAVGNTLGGAVGHAISSGEWRTSEGRRNSMRYGKEHRDDGLNAVGAFGGRIRDNITGKTQYDEAIGGFLDNKDNMSMAAGLYSGEKGERDAARKGMLRKIQGLKGDGKHISKADQGQIDIASAMVLGADPEFEKMMEEANSGGAVNPKFAEKMRSLTGQKHTEKELRQFAYAGLKGGDKAVGEAQEKLKEAFLKRENDKIQDDKTRLQASGGKIGPDGKLIVTGHGKATKAGEEIDAELTTIMNMDAGEERSVKLANMNKKIASMSAAERKALAIHGAGNAAGDMAARSLSAESRLSGRVKSKGGNMGAAVGDMFSLGLSKEEESALAKMDDEGKAGFLASKIGLTNQADVQKLQGALGGKDKALSAAALEELKGGLEGKAKSDLESREEGREDPNVRLLTKIQESLATIAKDHKPPSAEQIAEALKKNPEGTVET